jgi:hypothetical protein
LIVSRTSRIFKVKHKETGKYWQGYGSNFSVSGKEFRSALDAARQIDLARIRTSVPGQQLKDLVLIEEFEREVTKSTEPIQTIETDDALAVVRAYDHVHKKYGYSFCCLWRKVTTQPKFKDAKYLVKVDQDYEEFRERLKGLGYSSRHYTKQKDWIILFDDDVAMRVKLLSGYTEFVSMADIMADVK